ncbi:MAG TPA: FAD-dependent oxidoreductase [Pyrinomonadaceae bacterium]|nr:FAD-dependent oxidoreductase [Pyrinomonadaceae bacterium]
MNSEVVVVGGGIGGLTVAALLAARGVDVCLLERESRVGGCVTSFDKFGYSFEPGYGLYASWQPNEIHDRVFAELPVGPPQVRLMEPGYTVRLPDKSEISLTADSEAFENNLRDVFPECAEKAVSFYRKLRPVSAALLRVIQKHPDFLMTSRSRQAYALLPEGRVGAQILASSKHTALQHLDGLSQRFRRFLDVQLFALAQAGAGDVSYLYAALALIAPQGGLFGIQGGASALADRLAESIKQSGGRIRLNAPVLRLCYDSAGNPSGVDLLSGETVTASRAIISNLTLWDTYGKLIGLNRTPGELRKELKALRSWGAYLIYAGMDEAPVGSISSGGVLAFTDWQDGEEYNPENNQLFFTPAPSWDPRAPEGKRAATVHSFTDVDDWFTYHTDEGELEERDQQMLESCWGRLHTVMPALGNQIEVIDTVTPRTFYEQTRRKLGMVGGAIPTPEVFWANKPRYQSCFPNLFLVGDTLAPGGIAGVTNLALALANRLTSRT